MATVGLSKGQGGEHEASTERKSNLGVDVEMSYKDGRFRSTWHLLQQVVPLVAIPYLVVPIGVICWLRGANMEGRECTCTVDAPPPATNSA